MRTRPIDSRDKNIDRFSASIDARIPAAVLAAAILLLVVSPVFADAPLHRKAQVAVNIGNLRAEPSMEAPLAGKVYRGTVLHIEEQRGDWCRIRRAVTRSDTTGPSA